MGWRDQLKQAQSGGTLATAEPPKATGGWRDAVQQNEVTKWDRVKDWFTGGLRETEQTESLPEGIQLPFGWDGGRQPLAALGLMTTFDPVEQMSVLKKYYPDIVFSEDEKGNIIADASAYEGGGVGVMNAPGISMDDIRRLGFQIGAFTPAGRAAKGASLVGGAAKAGAASSATQAAMDVGGQYLGATAEGEQPGIQASEIDLVNVGLAGLGGAGGEMLARGLGRAFSFLRNVEEAPIDPSAKEAIKAATKELDDYAKQAGHAMPEAQAIDVFAQHNIPEEISQQILKNILPEEALGTASREATQRAQQYQIPLSQGQRTGSPAQLQFEESARMGAMGEGARSAATSMQNRQAAAIPQAIRNEAQKLADAPLVGSSVEAAESAIGGVQQRAGEMIGAVDEAYAAVPKGSYLSIDGAMGLIRKMRGAVRGGEYDKTLPKTAQALDDLAKTEKALSVLKGKNQRVPFEAIENYRKRLGRYIKAAGDNADQGQLIQIKGALDDYMDTAMADGLMFGDEATVDAIKKARSVRREYSELFEPQPKRTRAGVRDSDRAGVLINKMAELDPDPSEVVNALFASDRAFGKSGSAQLANRLKETLGADSMEWQQLRQAAFLRLFGVDKGQLSGVAQEGAAYISGQNTLRRLQEVLGGRGKNLANAMFTRDEINNMVELARAIKRAQPVPFNKSGTAGQMAYQNRLQSLAGKVMRSLSFTVDPTGGLLGGIAEKGVASIPTRQATAMAEQAFSGRPLQIVSPRAPTQQIAAPVSVQAATE